MTIDGHNHSVFSEKMQSCKDYIQALEEERCKIQVFRRELPLCLELVTQAIEGCKQQLSGTTMEYNLNVQSECSEQTSSDAPVLEEFIPIKRASSHSDGEEHESNKPKNDANICNKDGKNGNDDRNSMKSDWLRSVQLWSPTPDPPSKENSPRKVAVTEVKRSGSGCAFHPFKKEKNVAPPVNRSMPPPSPSSSGETGGSGGGKKKEHKGGQSQKKARRCWSPELHKRFLQALQQLRGSHLATPKQIRELMKVDGLTNDEVKSHLQKYRLHTRRPSSSVQNNDNHTAQTPQFVVVGGIWMPPEYTAMAPTATSGKAPGTAAASAGIYVPIASRPTTFLEASASPKQRHHNPPLSDERGGGSCDEGGSQSHSPAASSTHTTTASPAY